MITKDAIKTWRFGDDMSPLSNANERDTSRHLHLHIDEHRYSVIGKQIQQKHQQEPTNPREYFKKCLGKFECLIYEMLL